MWVGHHKLLQLETILNSVFESTNIIILEELETHYDLSNVYKWFIKCIIVIRRIIH